jgi:hypothetical protein
LDRERHDVDSKLGDNDSDWFDVSGHRVGKRDALPLVARFTNDRWDNTVGVCDRLDTRLDDGTLGSSTARGASRSYCSGPRRPPLTRVTQAERRELRLADSSGADSEPAIEGDSVCALFEQCLLPLASNVDAAFVAPWLHAFRSFTTPRSLFASASRCAASTRWRLSTRASEARSATRSCRARAPKSATCSTRGCCGTTRATCSPTASCFADCCAFLAQRTRPHALAQRPVGQLQ